PIYQLRVRPAERLDASVDHLVMITERSVAERLAHAPYVERIAGANGRTHDPEPHRLRLSPATSRTELVGEGGIRPEPLLSPAECVTPVTDPGGRSRQVREIFRDLEHLHED